MPSEENAMRAGKSKIAPSKRITGGQKSICRGVVSGALPAAWCDSVKTVSGIVHRPNSSSRLRRLIRVEDEQVRRDSRAGAVANADDEERDEVNGRARLVRADAVESELTLEGHREDQRARRVRVRADQGYVVLRNAQRLYGTL